MSSGFVSGGTADEPIERDGEWLKAQQEIEANHRRKEEESRQEGGKTLYEVLQSNKAAKQDAFEEAIRLKNQFRNLDEDEVEFLDSVLESTRKKEAEVKRETSEQLDLFRRQQEEADKAALEEAVEANDGEAAKGREEEEKWVVSKGKRKRVEEKKGLKGIKLRKASSSTRDDGGLDANAKSSTHATQSLSTNTTTSSTPTAGTTSQSGAIEAPSSIPKPKDTATPSLGLTGYSSDEED